MLPPCHHLDSLHDQRFRPGAREDFFPPRGVISARSRRARDFDGGYGLHYPGRWNSAGRPVTYCATVPSLAALEKRVHVVDPTNLPSLAMVEYETPDDLSQRAIELSALPPDWAAREVDTQRLGDDWLDSATSALLLVPSVILRLERAPERNVVINHRHPRVGEIRIAAVSDFTLDLRQFATEATNFRPLPKRAKRAVSGG